MSKDNIENLKKPDNKDTVTYGTFNWGPCVVQLRISDGFRDKLLEGAEEARNKKINYQDKLAGIIKEEYAYSNKEKYLSEIAQCLGVYDVAFQKFKNETYAQKPEYLVTALWVNYMKKHEYNPPHDHSDTLSFVIFLDVPKEITQEQKDYVGKSGGPGGLSFLWGDGTRQAITYQSIIPKTNDMYIFPAWLKHYVAPFYSDVTRISVSGNITDSVFLNQLKKHKQANIVSHEDIEKK
jgi:hypothetical protein|tara:strand:- start:733 stop:1443 length:711 start_codon:yes stop_codon:yes gene_type:complete